MRVPCVPYDDCMSKDSNSHQRFAFPVLLYDEHFKFAELPTEIHVVPTGEWEHPYYGKMVITSSDITEFKKNFDDGVRLDLRITAGHDNGMSGGELPAIAWIRELHDRGVLGLFATVEWTSEGQKLLKDKAYKYLSPEFYEQYKDPETGEVRTHVLVGAALTNMPYFKELTPVLAFSEPTITKQLFNEPIHMDLKDIRVMKASELNDEQKTFLIAHKAELTKEERATFTEIVGEEETPAPVIPTPPVEVKVEASEMTQINASDLAKLQEDATKGREAMEKIVASERAAFVSSLMFSQTNNAGRFSVAQQGAVEKFVATLSEDQRKQFGELVKGIPTNTEKLFTEIGDGGSNVETTATGIAAEVKKLATEKIEAAETKGKKLSYTKAVMQVYAEKPDLKTAYDKAVSESN